MKNLQKKIKCLLFFSFYFSFLQPQVYAQKSEQYYQFSIDLKNVQNDQLKVELIVPKMKSSETIYHLPKIVPGTYEMQNYGAFASEFKAFDENNTELKVSKLDKNSWKIDNASKLYKVSYLVDDTWDTPSIQEDIFEPAGTNIQKDTLFVINSFGFFGYFKGHENRPYQVSIVKPNDFYGSTSLELSKKSSQNIDVFYTKDYHVLADSPLIYCKPDIALIKIGNTDVLVSVFSPNKKANAELLAKDIKPILEAQTKYLGGTLPVKKYAFLIYLTDWKNLTRYGALEHSQSSLLFLPESMSPTELSATVKNVAAHEFFHIVTPLNIHSEEIGNFDYINPKMSKHLWLYEGLTEYATHHAQLKGKIIDLNTYLERQTAKVNNALKLFDDKIPFTKLSSKTLDEYKSQYQNVYEKGALIGLCLDLKLRKLSDGQYGTQNLLQDLSKIYGKNKSFKDEELFDKISELTYPEIRDFFTRYVEGSESIPLQEVMEYVGIEYNPNSETRELELAIAFGMGVIPNTNRLFVSKIGENNLSKRLGYQLNDELLSFNGEEFNLDTYGDVFQKYSENAKIGQTLSILVKRGDKEIMLSAQLQEETIYIPSFKVVENATKDQLKLRKIWTDF